MWGKWTILSVPCNWKLLVKPICWQYQDSLHAVFHKWDRSPKILKYFPRVESFLHCQILKILWTANLKSFYQLDTIWYIWWQSLPFNDDIFVFNVVVGHPLFMHIFHCFYHLNIRYYVFLLLCISCIHILLACILVISPASTSQILNFELFCILWSASISASTTCNS